MFHTNINRLVYRVWRRGDVLRYFSSVFGYDFSRVCCAHALPPLPPLLQPSQPRNTADVVDPSLSRWWREVDVRVGRRSRRRCRHWPRRIGGWPWVVQGPHTAGLRGARRGVRDGWSGGRATVGRTRTSCSRMSPPRAPQRKGPAPQRTHDRRPRAHTYSAALSLSAGLGGGTRIVLT